MMIVFPILSISDMLREEYNKYRAVVIICQKGSKCARICPYLKLYEIFFNGGVQAWPESSPARIPMTQTIFPGIYLGRDVQQPNRCRMNQRRGQGLRPQARPRPRLRSLTNRSVRGALSTTRRYHYQLQARKCFDV